MDWTKVLLETLSVSYSTILKMTFIIIPLLIAIECLKDMGWLEKISARFRGVTKLLRLPGEAALGLIVALFVGLLFGSGVIMQINEEVKMTRTQMNILFAFVGICHAVIEETILFTAIGANGAIILLSRILSSLLFGFMFIWITTWTTGIKRDRGFSAKEGD
ncbi:MAG TPA: nucleoside recognition domain-containing protein [Clostridia bacterium]|nr:nucleoside recognition domain-containing protein [Clostridia bacterium]